jgi:hypothetical protein
MRGKRTAMPALCRLDLAMPSKPISNTMVGRRCAPDRIFPPWCADCRIDLADLGIGQAGIRFGERHQHARPPSGSYPTPQRCSRCRARHGGRGRPGRRSAPRRRVGIDLPLPPGADILGAADAVLRIGAFQHHAFDRARARRLRAGAPSVPSRRLDQRRQHQLRTCSRALTTASSRAARRCGSRAGRRHPVPAGRRRPAPPAVRPAFCGEVLRPMRFCRSANEAGRPVLPDQDFAIDHGAVRQRHRAISGKRSVIRSSPRDHSQLWPLRRTSWARMPSYFHSTSQSSDVAQRLVRPAAACARKKGYGWPPRN